MEMSSDLKWALILLAVIILLAGQLELKGLKSADLLNGSEMPMAGKRITEMIKKLLLNLSTVVFPVMLWGLAAQTPRVLVKMQIPKKGMYQKRIFVAKFPGYLLIYLSGISIATLPIFRKMHKS